MQTLPPPTAAPRRAPVPSPVAAPGGGRWPDVLLAVGAAALALAIRWPHLWTVPRFTDETLEVLHALRIVREGARPLTNYDSYYGALSSYLLAAALWLGGESWSVPRLVALGAAVLTVAATYALGRELARAAGPALGNTCASRDRGSALLPRAAGTLAALLLATNGVHVVVNSHIAWSNCLTPLFTTLAFWLLLRARCSPRSRGPGLLTGGPALALAGLLFGLALQTHPLVAALLPGAALYVLRPGRRWLRTPWPYLGLALFLVGYANVVLYNWETGFESIRSAQRIRAEYAQDQQATIGYLPTLGALLLLLARILGGAVDQRGGAGDYLAEPAVILGSALAGVGLVWLARRREPLPLLLVVGFVLLLPLFNSKFRALLAARYLMPIVPLLFAATAAYLVHFVGPLLARRPSLLAHRRREAALAIGAALAAVALILAPLAPLGRYYARAYERSDTNERILGLTTEILAARRADEPVLVDEAIGSELPDTGVTELRGFEHLLEFARVPHRAVRVSPGRLQEEVRAVPSVLAVLNARDAAEAAGRLSVVPLDARPPATTGRMFDYRLYRVASSR
jgi:hypothetical protein